MVYELSTFRETHIEPTSLCMGFEIRTRRDAGEPLDNLLEVLNLVLQIPQPSHVSGHFTSIAR